jgi:hypothetical protein
MTATPQTPARLSAGDLVARLTPFQRAKIAFLFAGFASFVLSVTLWFFVDRELGLFVGLWVPAIHSLGTLVLVEPRS